MKPSHGMLLKLRLYCSANIRGNAPNNASVQYSENGIEAIVDAVYAAEFSMFGNAVYANNFKLISFLRVQMRKTLAAKFGLP